MESAASAPAKPAVGRARLQAGRLAAWTRMCVAFVCAALVLLALLLSRMGTAAAVAIAAAAGLLCAANAWYVLRDGRSHGRAPAALLVALDSLFVAWSAWWAVGGAGQPCGIVLLGGSVVVVALAVLSYTPALVLLAGLLSVSASGVVEWLRLDRGALGALAALQEFLLMACFVALVAALGRVVCRALREAADACREREAAVAQREQMVHQLYQYRRMESLGALAGGMAHDFNNILQTVVDLCARIQAETREESTARHAAGMSEQLDEARFLVSELLALGAREPLVLDVVDVADLLTEVQRVMAGRLPQTWHVQVECRDRPLAVRGDRRHLRRVLENLVQNSRDAMPAGGTVTLECSRQTRPDGGRVVVRVRDTGSGVSPEVVDRVFDPFVTTKERGKGTGLGLALAQHIMALHKGSIVLEATGPTGSVFRLEFPAGEALEIDHDTRWMLSSRVRAGVLVLDDDARIRDVLRAFLVDLKYPTWQAGGLDEAEALLREHREECRVLVTDWKLGSEQPAQVVSRLRQVRPDLHVVVVSGYAPDRQAMQRLGIRRWLVKPYDRTMLDIEIQRELHL